MVNVTIAVPETLKVQLDGRPEINWSEVARQAWREKLERLNLLDQLTSKSAVSEEDIEELARKLKRGIAKRHEKG